MSDIQISDDDLERERRYKSHARLEKRKNQTSYIIMCVMWCIALSFIICLGIWIYSLFNDSYFTPQAIDKVTMVLSHTLTGGAGGIGALLLKTFKQTID